MRRDRRRPTLIVIDRGGLVEKVEAACADLKLDANIARFGSVLEVVGESGPSVAAGVVASTAAAGPFLQDILRWTDRDHGSRIPAAVVGSDGDEASISAVLGRDHVRWIDDGESEAGLRAFLPMVVEVHDLRTFRLQHDTLAAQLREARMRMYYGELAEYLPPEGAPCGPPLPTHVEEILPLRDARAQYERGLIRAAIRECGSLKHASAALGISYTSLWRRLR